jgi:hypothetical protein
VQAPPEPTLPYLLCRAAEAWPQQLPLRRVGCEGVGGAAAEIVEEQGGETVEGAGGAEDGGRRDLADLGLEGRGGGFLREGVEREELSGTDSRTLGVKAALNQEVERVLKTRPQTPATSCSARAGADSGRGK